jgi:hypothetical protein
MGQKEDYNYATAKSKCRCGFDRHNRRRGRPSYLLHPAGTIDLTPTFNSIKSNDRGKFELTYGYYSASVRKI